MKDDDALYRTLLEAAAEGIVIVDRRGRVVLANLKTLELFGYGAGELTGREIEAFGPQRVAVDSLSALERVSTLRGFREFVIGLTSFVKHRQIAGLFTATTPTLMGGLSDRGAHIDHHRFDHPAPVRGTLRRRAARHHGHQDAGVEARKGGPGILHRAVQSLGPPNRRPVETLV